MPKLDKKIIGNNFRELREGVGLSQHDLSTLLEISKRTLANLELGHTKMHIGLLQRLMSFYDIEDLNLICNENFGVSVNLREKLQVKYGKEKEYSTLLNKQPTLVYAIKYKLLLSDFLNEPKQVNDVRKYFKSLGWTYLGTSISSALKRLSDIVLITPHGTKKNTNLYQLKK